MNRPDLMQMLGKRVTVTNPHAGSTWTGTLAALGDEPCAVIDEDDGARFCIPQSFTITRAAEPQPAATTNPCLHMPVEESRDGEIQAALDSLASMNRITRTTAEDVRDVVHALRLAGYRVVRELKTRDQQEADRG